MSKIQRIFFIITISYLLMACFSIIAGYFLPIELIDLNFRDNYYISLGLGIPAAIILTIIWTWRYSKRFKRNANIAVNTVYIGIGLIIPLIVLIYPLIYKHWVDKAIIYRNIKDSNKTINIQELDPYRFHSGLNRTVILVPFLKYWNIVKDVDIKTINKNEWKSIKLSKLNSLSDFDYWKARIVNDESIEIVKKSLDSDDYIISFEKDEIPNQLIDVLTAWRNEVFTISNSNEIYDSTDTVDGSLPTRQLISIFRNKDSFFIQYNHGGIGHHKHLIWCSMFGDDIMNIWICNSKNLIKDIEGLRNELDNFSRTVVLSNGEVMINNTLCF